jgi:RNA 2',3'-cyclic 3'-phosphodiesterase
VRLFIALDIEDQIRERIARFMDGVRGFAPDARWVRPESMHVTLKFIGEKPDQEVENMKRVLTEVRAVKFALAFRGYGFFPTPKSARVFWVGIEAGEELPKLVAAIDESTAALGIAKDERAFSPHLTLARGGGRSGAPGWRKDDGPNRNFQLLQQKLSGLTAPEFGTMTAQEFFLYQSQLLRGGSCYTKLARFSLT